MTVTHFIIGAVVFLTGIALGYWLLRWKERNLRQEQLLRETNLREKARLDSDALLREARLSANEESLHIRAQTEQLFEGRRKDLDLAEQRVNEREALVNRQLETFLREEKVLAAQKEECRGQEQLLEKTREQLSDLVAKRRAALESVAQLSSVEARAQLLKQVEQDASRDAGNLTRHILDDAKIRAEEKARKILAVAIQRYAGEHTFETSTATVALPSDEMKGRIIGREGRNIRAFEAATGITVLIDDTPNAVVLSGFDPVRREIARDAMERLILDGRIHPTRIEEVVAKVSQEMDENILRAGEDAVLRAGLAAVHSEILKVLGRLRFRHSFSQNILEHSIEVAHLMGLMAAEIGIDVASAKRAGLLHDIGKAMSHEIEGPHAIVGAEFIKRHGESEAVVDGVASHHDEVEHNGLLG
ncbi:MAG: ribonuclease Y, partial [Verrucomicrobiota bacterium]